MNVFVERIREEVEERMDMAALEQVKTQERSGRHRSWKCRLAGAEKA